MSRGSARGACLAAALVLGVYITFGSHWRRRPPPREHPRRPEWVDWQLLRTEPPAAAPAEPAAPEEAFLIDTPGCRIPDLAANSSDVAPFVMDYDMGGDCGDPPPLVLSTDTALLVDREALAAYGARGPEDVSCCYTAMWRVRPGVAVPDWPRGHTMPPTREGPLFDGITHGDHIRFGDRCEPFFEAAAVVHEFVRVNCTVWPAGGARALHLHDYHAFVPAKAAQGPRADVADDSLSVLIVGVDSVSRLNWLRTMPRTRAVLEQRLGARSMLGYNKVEDNTFPNLVALLSGMSVPELRKTCWGSDNTAHFDACPWVWKRFRREGYVNMFAEDSAWMGLFHYLKRGFVLQPTEYDPRPLLYLGGKHLGRALRRGSHQVCIGQRRELDVLLDYGRKFVRAMQRDRRKFFGIVWGSSMSHDDLNSASAADEAYADYLGDVLATGVLNRTALVFISDHGLRFGDILTTRQGRLEERLPLMYTVLPEWVRRRYPRAVRNLEGNANRLVTLYDVHETLYNYMHLPSLRALEGPPPPPASGAPPPRGRSLFSQIPDDRTCATAGVPKHYCACQTTVAVPADDHRVLQVAEFLVSEVNARLQHAEVVPDAAGYVCARLAVDAIVDARRGPVGPVGSGRASAARLDPLEHQYELVVRARPSGALLSATVLYRVGTATMALDGSISRINAYGKQSWCVKDFKLRLMCYCLAPATPDP